MLATTWWRYATLFCCGLISLLGTHSLVAQESASKDLQQMLRAGEFTTALDLASEQTDPQLRDRMYSEIAGAQHSGDTGLNAFDTLARIQDDNLRFGSFDRITDYGGNGFGNDGFGGGQNNQGNQGGVTAQDFTELMNLIQETIDPDSWEQNGGNGRMMPFPSGVWVDSTGTMKRIERDKSGRLDRVRDQVTLEDESLATTVELRKVSLARLERELQMRAAAGKPVPEEMKHLAGIYQLKFIILYPETRDVVIAGPAGPWHYDKLGRAVNTSTGQPVLNLDDLVVCLKNARQNSGQFTCSIDPRQQNLADAKQFVDTTSMKGSAFRKELQARLGKMDVTVGGIDASTHASRVIVEADYRMKLIGLGVEPTVSGLDNYFERIQLTESGDLPEMDQLVRWWFTMDYDSVQTNSDRTVFELNGQGVKLLSESEFWDQTGERQHTGTSSAPAKGFADDFTKRFPEIASTDPVFGQLKNLFDCAIASSIIHKEGLDKKVNWNLAFLAGSAKPGLLSYQVDVAQVPVQVDSILGQRVITHREGRSTRRHTISGFGGGVEFDASKQVSGDKIKVTKTSELSDSRTAAAPKKSAPETWSSSWSWD